MALEIEVRDEGEWRIISTRGEVDINWTPEIRKAVLEAGADAGSISVSVSGEA